MRAWGALFFGILIANLPIARWMDHHKVDLWLHVAYGISVFSFLFGQVPLLLWFSRWQARKYGLLCPACAKPLFGVSAQVAIATGNCDHCGSEVFTTHRSGSDSYLDN